MNNAASPPHRAEGLRLPGTLYFFEAAPQLEAQPPYFD